jgi:NAD(P)-dependent dehydrogenase (short-subunit alcohol dehydrogenase family)
MPTSNRWTAEDIPDQQGRVAIVTGANSGLGLVTARMLAAAGATVVLACRNEAKAQEAAAEIGRRVPGATVEVGVLDLGDLASIEGFSAEQDARHERIDLLVNNAGVMYTPRGTTADGFELQFGTNHLGHFALTGRLLPALLRTEGSRVVTVSSLEHRRGHLRLDDLMLEKGYGRYRAYRQSKLANASFAIELDRRLRTAGVGLISTIAHPGYSATNLQVTGPPLPDRVLAAIGNRLLAQSAEMGALPQVYAATAPGVVGGSYIGPGGIGELRGHPKVVQAIDEANDPDIARRLWDESERLTGVRYDLPA